MWIGVAGGRSTRYSVSVKIRPTLEDAAADLAREPASPTAVRHRHSRRCLEVGAAAGVCQLSYAEWIRLAGDHPNQDRIWREHERIARQLARGNDADLGGEG